MSSVPASVFETGLEPPDDRSDLRPLLRLGGLDQLAENKWLDGEQGFGPRACVTDQRVMHNLVIRDAGALREVLQRRPRVDALRAGDVVPEVLVPIVRVHSPQVTPRVPAPGRAG